MTSKLRCILLLFFSFLTIFPKYGMGTEPSRCSQFPSDAFLTSIRSFLPAPYVLSYSLPNGFRSANCSFYRYNAYIASGSDLGTLDLITPDGHHFHEKINWVELRFGFNSDVQSLFSGLKLNVDDYRYLVTVFSYTDPTDFRIYHTFRVAVGKEGVSDLLIHDAAITATHPGGFQQIVLEAFPVEVTRAKTFEEND